MTTTLEYTPDVDIASKTKLPSSLAEYLTMPDEAPYYEFINGIAHFMPSPSTHHQECLGELYSTMKAFAKERQLGKVFIAPLDVYLSDEEYYQPDMLFVSNERKSIIQERIKGAPDLVVEVLSPSNGYKDLTHKKLMYEEFGVREYWTVEPDERAIEVLVNTDLGFQVFSKAHRRGEVRSQVLSGFTVNLDQIFSA